MNREEILNDKYYNFRKYDPILHPIDPAIKPLVDYLNNLGFITFASCSSHMFTQDNRPFNDPDAYVAFYYADEDIDKVYKFMDHKFPKIKGCKITMDRTVDDPNVLSIHINFNYVSSLFKRAKILKQIYDSLGIVVSDKFEHSEDMFKKRIYTIKRIERGDSCD